MDIESSESHWAKRIKPFLLRHFLPIGLVSSILFGFFVPAPGLILNRTPLSYIAIAIIFLISGLYFDTDEMKRASTYWRSLLFGVVSIIGLTPLTSLIIMQLPFYPSEFAIGLALFCLGPTTLNSSVILAREAGGNVSISIFLTLASNLLAIFTVPFLVPLLVISDTNVELSPWPLLWKLALVILLPLIVGKALSFHKRLFKFLSKYKTTFKITANCLLFVIPLMKVSASSDRLKSIDFLEIFTIILAGIGLHSYFLLLNYSCIYFLTDKDKAANKATLISASQKTLPVALAVVGAIPEHIGATGLFAIPIIISHFCQTIIDAFLATAWRERTEALENITIHPS